MQHRNTMRIGIVNSIRNREKSPKLLYQSTYMSLNARQSHSDEEWKNIVLHKGAENSMNT